MTDENNQTKFFLYENWARTKTGQHTVSIVDKIENWKNTKRKKTTSVDEKEKDEVKLHAALVLNITFWAIYEPRRDT